MSDYEFNNEEKNEKVLLQAETTEAFVERRRFQDLFDARSEALEPLRKWPALRNEVRDQRQLREETHAAVRTYLTESGQLFRATDFGRELWTERVLGPVSLSESIPNLDQEQIVAVDGRKLPDGIQMRGEKLLFKGLRAYHGLSDAFVDVEYEKRVISANPNATKPEGGTVPLVPPKKIAEEAFEATDELLGELGVLGQLTGDDYDPSEPGL
ncbi:hypothetical protein [Haloferax marisrubri]|uniref:Uncharacterized protein n=1 Tax=Haloferax marisrubri TaxID=1544719 RepID=A0A2P4NVU0_9EURY|nr:hypothetical protein [Haloferax marisrubri]POG57254.1 hypothetical protein AUR65_001445 [Haloferax marisrubri]